MISGMPLIKTTRPLQRPHLQLRHQAPAAAGPPAADVERPGDRRPQYLGLPIKAGAGAAHQNRGYSRMAMGICAYATPEADHRSAAAQRNFARMLGSAPWAGAGAAPGPVKNITKFPGEGPALLGKGYGGAEVFSWHMQRQGAAFSSFCCLYSEFNFARLLSSSLLKFPVFFALHSAEVMALDVCGFLYYIRW